MGTRNLTCVVKDGEYKIAKYGQWDGYLNGVGRDLMEVVKDVLKEDKMDDLIKKIDLVREVTDNELKACVLSCGGYEDEQFGLSMSMDASDNFKSMFPSLHRDTSGADLIKLILESDEAFLVDKSLEFAASSLFCEWCYVVDLDKKTFEIYKGFNQEPLQEGERFYFLKELVENEYDPVKFFAEISFDDLKNKEVGDVINEIDIKEED